MRTNLKSTTFLVWIFLFLFLFLATPNYAKQNNQDYVVYQQPSISVSPSGWCIVSYIADYENHDYKMGNIVKINGDIIKPLQTDFQAQAVNTIITPNEEIIIYSLKINSKDVGMKMDKEGNVLIRDHSLPNSSTVDVRQISNLITSDNGTIGGLIGSMEVLGPGKTANKSYIEIDDELNFIREWPIISDFYAGYLLRLGTDNNLHLKISNLNNTGIIYYLKFDRKGSILLNLTPLNKVSTVHNLPIVTDEYGNLIYLDGNGIVDSNNNIHILTLNPASLLYTKLNSAGTKIIENQTIATHEGNPLDNDPKVVIDSEDNIHFTWEAGGWIYYMKIDPNGTVLIPAMKIAPEDGTSKDSTPGFEMIPLIMIVVVAAAVKRRRR